MTMYLIFIIHHLPSPDQLGGTRKKENQNVCVCVCVCENGEELTSKKRRVQTQVTQLGGKKGGNYACQISERKTTADAWSHRDAI